MGLLEKIAAARGAKAFTQPPFWAGDGLASPLWSTSSLLGDKEKIETSFEGYVQGAYKSSGVVFACMLVRQWLFAEARFQWSQMVKGRRGNLFGTPELALLEQPWPGGTTGELLARMEINASTAGNYYGTTADDEGRVGRAARGERRIVHMRPDWTTIVINSASGNPNALDARVAGYLYEPPATGTATAPEPLLLLPSEVCHYSPIPDPIAKFRGMSWLTPVIEEIRADKAATKHKAKFFENGATPNFAVSFAEANPETFAKFVEMFKDQHEGVDNAYKTLFLGGGADITPLAVDFRQLDFKSTQGTGETRVAAAAGVHPTVVGLSEGMQGSSLNAGNFNAACRLTANKTLRPLWRMASASLQTLVTPPTSGFVQLWYDDRDIPFLYDDATDLATVRSKDAQTLRALVDGGFEPDAAVEFVTTNDLNRLMGQHTGMVPVQLQPPGSGNGTDGRTESADE